MSGRVRDGSPPAARRSAAQAVREEESVRERWEARQSALLDRFDEPIERATEITRRTLAWFPVRVWRHFLRHNGFLLAASISYQSLFAMFAVLYFVFAAVGIWLGGSESAVQGLIGLVNRYVPNLISESGLVTPEAVADVASTGGGVLAITGAIAVVVAVWTAIGFVTFTRRAVRDIFGLPFDSRNYFLLKARDFVAAVAFGVALVAGAVLGTTAVGAVDLLLSLFGVQFGSFLSELLVRVVSIPVALAINALALAGLFRFLTGASLPWRAIRPGSLLGGAALAVLQVGAGLVLLYTPSNPLLATFSVFVGLLLWFRLSGIVILVAASWIAVTAADRDIPIAAVTEAQRLVDEHAALLTAAEVRLRTARAAQDAAPWWRAWGARRAVRDARDELVHVERSAPPPSNRGSLLE